MVMMIFALKNHSHHYRAHMHDGIKALQTNDLMKAESMLRLAKPSIVPASLFYHRTMMQLCKKQLDLTHTANEKKILEQKIKMHSLERTVGSLQRRFRGKSSPQRLP
jgi:hypothetical protein